VRTDNKSRFRLKIQKVVFTVLLLTIVGLLSWLSLQNSTQFDWSVNNSNSISEKSIQILNTMDDDIVVRAYVPKSIATQKGVTEILRRYQREKSNFEFKLLNVEIDLEIAMLDKVTSNLQYVIAYKDKSEKIASLSENAISGALLRLSHDEERRIIFLTGHGERNPTEGNNHGFSQLTTQLQTNGFKVDKIHLLQDNIKPNTDVLVIAGASKPLLAGEVDKIRAYIKAGGNLLWLADPGELHGMRRLANDLALDFYEGLVVDNNIDVRKTLQIEHPAIVPVLEYYPHKITEGLQYNTLFPTSRGVSRQQNTDEEPLWQISPLFASFAQSWSESNGITSEIVFDASSGDIAGPITLGISLERKIKEDTHPSKISQRIVAVGDSDFLANSYIGAGANLTLGLNIMNWLAGDDTLISITPKGAPDTQLKLNDIEIVIISMGFFIAIPLFLLITGISIWLKRRNT